MKRALLLTSVTAALVWVGASIIRSSSVKHSPDSGDSSRKAVAPVLPGGAPCSFAVGTELAYQLDISTHGQLDNTKVDFGLVPEARGREYFNQTKGTFQLKALSVDERGTVLVGRFTSIDEHTLQGGGDVTPPFLVRIGPRCALTGFARLDVTDLGAARTQQAMLYELMWAVPEGETLRNEGSNSLGQYSADYRRHDADGDTWVEREHQVYSQVWESPGAALNLTPRRSTMQIRRGGAWFAALTSSESSQGLSVLNALTQTAATAIDVQPGALDAAVVDTNRYIWEDLLPRHLKPLSANVLTAEQRAANEALRAKDLGTVVDGLVTSIHSGNGVSQSWPPIAKYLEARPEMIRPFANKLVHDEVPEEARAMAYVALSNTHAPEAKLALNEILTNEANQLLHRSRAAFALVSRDDVDMELAQTLASYSSAISQGKSRNERLIGRESALALGMMAGLQAQRLPDVKKFAVSTAQALLAVPHANEMRPAFGTLANVGDPTVLPLVQNYAQSPDAAIRQGAAVVIRRMRPSDTESFTLNWLARESDQDVKLRLYDIIEMQHFDAHVVPSPNLMRQIVADLTATPRPPLPTRQSLIKMAVRAYDANRHDTVLREVLLRQMPVEHELGSGLYDLMAPSFSVTEVASVMEHRVSNEGANLPAPNSVVQNEAGVSP